MDDLRAKVEAGYSLWYDDFTPEMSYVDTIEMANHLDTRCLMPAQWPNEYNCNPLLEMVLGDLNIVAPILAANAQREWGDRAAIVSPERLVTFLSHTKKKVDPEMLGIIEMSNFPLDMRLGLVWLVKGDGKIPSEETMGSFGRVSRIFKDVKIPVERLRIISEKFGEIMARNLTHENICGFLTLANQYIDYDTVRFLVQEVGMSPRVVASHDRRTDAILETYTIRQFKQLSAWIEEGKFSFYYECLDGVMKRYENWTSALSDRAYSEMLHGRMIDKLEYMLPYMPKEDWQYHFIWMLNYCHAKKEMKWRWMSELPKGSGWGYQEFERHNHPERRVLLNGMKFLRDNAHITPPEEMLCWTESMMHVNQDVRREMAEVTQELLQERKEVEPAVTNKLTVLENSMRGHWERNVMEDILRAGGRVPVKAE